MGESEPLRAYGVLLSEAAVQQEALRLGLTRTTKELSEQAKVQARASLIKKGLAKAGGDRERTKDSPANLQREVGGRTNNALTDLGGAVLPICKELLAQVNSAGQGIGDSSRGTRGRSRRGPRTWSPKSGRSSRVPRTSMPRSRSSSGVIGAMIGRSSATSFNLYRDAFGVTFRTIVDLLETAGVAMRNWDAITQIAGIQINQSLTDIGATFQWLGTAAGAFLNWFDANWKSIFADALTVTLTLFQSFGDTLKGQFDQIKGFLSDPLHFEVDFSKFNPVENFKKLAEDLGKVELKTPPLVIPKLELDHAEADRQIAEITEGIGRREAERAARKKQGTTAAAAAGGPAQEEQAAAAADSAAAAVAAPKAGFQDLVSFAKNLQIGGLSGKDNVQNKQLDELKSQNRQLRGMALGIS